MPSLLLLSKNRERRIYLRLVTLLISDTEKWNYAWLCVIKKMKVQQKKPMHKANLCFVFQLTMENSSSPTPCLKWP